MPTLQNGADISSTVFLFVLQKFLLGAAEFAGLGVVEPRRLVLTPPVPPLPVVGIVLLPPAEVVLPTVLPSVVSIVAVVFISCLEFWWGCKIVRRSPFSRTSPSIPLILVVVLVLVLVIVIGVLILLILLVIVALLRGVLLVVLLWGIIRIGVLVVLLRRRRGRLVLERLGLVVDWKSPGAPVRARQGVLRRNGLLIIACLGRQTVQRQRAVRSGHPGEIVVLCESVHVGLDHDLLNGGHDSMWRDHRKTPNK